MHRYNDEGQMIDTDTINKSLLAQEIIINFIPRTVKPRGSARGYKVLAQQSCQ